MSGDAVTTSVSGRPSLFAHGDFRRLWAAETASQLGVHVGGALLPLLAVTALSVTPFEMGVLSALRNVGFLLVGLQAGAWIDRWRRRRVMLVADAGRALLLASLPVAWWAGVLTLAQLLLVALAAGFCTVFFDVAYQSFLPTLLARDRLAAGNARLEASNSVSRIGGPAAGGVLAQLAGAANSMAATAACFAMSALFVSRIRQSERPPPRAAGARLRTEVAEGISAVLRSRELRAILAFCTVSNFFSAGFFALQVIYLIDVVRLPAATVGLVMAGGGIGGLLGALTATRWTARLGQLRALAFVPLGSYPFLLLMPLASAEWAAGPSLAALTLFGYGVTVFNVAQVSYRQMHCPAELLGRMNATFRFVSWGVTPLGSLAAGVLADLIGLRPSVFAAAVGTCAAPLFVLALAVRGDRVVV